MNPNNANQTGPPVVTRSAPIDIPNPQNGAMWQQLNPELAAHHAAQRHHAIIWNQPPPITYPYWIHPHSLPPYQGPQIPFVAPQQPAQNWTAMQNPATGQCAMQNPATGQWNLVQPVAFQHIPQNFGPPGWQNPR